MLIFYQQIPPFTIRQWSDAAQCYDLGALDYENDKIKNEENENERESLY